MCHYPTNNNPLLDSVNMSIHHTTNGSNNVNMKDSYSLLKEAVELNDQAIALMKETRHGECLDSLQGAIARLELHFMNQQAMQQQQLVNGNLNYTNHNGFPVPFAQTHPSSFHQWQQQQQYGPQHSQPQPPHCQNQMSQQRLSVPGTAVDGHGRDHRSGVNHQPNGAAYTSVPIPMSGTHMEYLLSQNIFCLFPRMFRIHLDHALTMEFSKLYTILLYNQALCLHMNALMYLAQHHQREHPMPHLKRILWLYERIVAVAQVSFSHADVQDMLTVLVATANNSGHVCSHLLLFSESTQSVARILQLLALSNDTTFHPEDLKIFFASVCIFLEGNTLKNAPAA